MTHISFEYNGATIVVQSGTGRTAVRQTALRVVSGMFELDSDYQQSEIMESTYVLAHTVSVEGDLGFPVPIGEPSKEAIEAFTDALMDCEKALMNRWDNAIEKADKAANAPDLLPPEKQKQAKKKTPKS